MVFKTESGRETVRPTPEFLSKVVTPNAHLIQSNPGSVFEYGGKEHVLNRLLYSVSGFCHLDRQFRGFLTVDR